jgi:TatD DNase family protein
MPEYIDTHAHLYLPEFDADRESIVDTAVYRGVKRILLPNIDSTTIDPMNKLAEKFQGVCYPMMGLHPTSVKDNYREELDRVEKELTRRRYCAVGEIGIDLYWDKTHLKEQNIAFRAQLDLALKYNLPVAIHARESFNEILEVLDDYKNKGLRGVFHAFTGTAEIANDVVGRGFLIGIGGIITYKKSSLPEVILETGLPHIILETDSPFLTPVPFRGKRNESSYIPYIAEALAIIKDTTPEEVARVTTTSACKLFQLDTYA